MEPPAEDQWRYRDNPVQAVARGVRLDQALLLGHAVGIEPDDLAGRSGLMAEDLDFTHGYGCRHRYLLADSLMVQGFRAVMGAVEEITQVRLREG